MSGYCDTCTPSEDGLFGRIIGKNIIEPKDNFQFIDGTDITVSITTLSDGTKAVQHNYSPYVAPTVSFNVSPSFFEVGDTVPSANFTLNVTERSNTIDSITVVPDPGITLNVGNNTWSVANITSNVAGNVGTHTATISDNSANPNVTVNTSLNARWRYYQGFSTKSTLTETDIKALVNDDLSTGIKSLYGGNNTYTVPTSAVNQFIYWSYPEGTNGIQSLSSGGFVVPFTVAGTVPITNSFGITENYIVVRTSNALGSGDIQINMN